MRYVARGNLSLGESSYEIGDPISSAAMPTAQ
jgi:hypothetical protein